LDYYQILVSILLAVFGIWILLRELLQGRLIVMAWVLGGSFLAFGLYRLKYVVDYFRGVKDHRS